MSVFMSFVTRIIDFREAAQVASLALAYQAISPDNLISTISTIALAEIGNHGIDLACKWVNEISLLKQDIQKLIDDDADYQKFLEMEPFLVDGHTNLSTTTFTENSEFNSNVLNEDTLGVIALHLTIEELAKFALVSKSFYSATKADSIWHRKLNEHFPELKCISREECGFSPEQQVKMVYKRTLYPLKQIHSHDSFWIYQMSSMNDGNRRWNGYYDEQLEKDYNDFAKKEGFFESYLRQGKMALDIQARLIDFPKRVSDMKKLAAKNPYADIFIHYLLLRDAYICSLESNICCFTLMAFFTERRNELRLIPGSNRGPFGNSGSYRRLDAMLAWRDHVEWV